jgi:translation initiation factor 2 beta subunit (eIF-2beta)/eIF-5
MSNKILVLMDFNTLVNNAYLILDQQSRGENLILPDIIIEIGTTRLHWKNVKDFLKIIQRHPDHFMDWLKSELPSQEINWFSGSKADGLIIHGKRQKKSDITDMALKYVNNYVICSSCKHADTKMIKINHKQWEFECMDCGMKKFIM